MLVFFSTKFYTKVLHAKNNYTNVLLAKKKKNNLTWKFEVNQTSTFCVIQF